MPLKAKLIDSELESLSKAKAVFIEPMLCSAQRHCPKLLAGCMN